MRRFVIYLVEEEFCHHFFGNEDRLYNLFYQYEFKQDMQAYNVVKRQVQYITRRVPIQLLKHEIGSRIKSRPDGHILLNTFYIDANDTRASLSLHQNFLLLRSSGTYEAETIFFEALRKIDSYFLAIDYHNKNYGWLNPIKQRKFV
ncbi:sporulation inhibitor of replication protein SirA [Bacillus marinisedimentorum]|uniref:sporulation inhibitor of replication protein SirA n=1 Tax=Bacillus marinisedimentorum TaxID=1821260 RepID=UPI0007DF30FD|nr:sporulation inhibitor of replication protein SirA [Bacillus marinisedimentorum]